MTDNDRRELHTLIGKYGLMAVIQELIRLLYQWSERAPAYKGVKMALMGAALRLGEVKR